MDVLDIKPSACRLVVGSESRRRVSQAVAEAVHKLREYLIRLDTTEVRSFLKRKYDLSVSNPTGMVLIGRDLDFKTNSEKALFSNTGGVRVYTYDDLRRIATRRLLRLRTL